jgi:hypothetical protein
VVDRFVCGKLCADAVIEFAFISVQAGFAVNVVADDLGDVFTIGLRRME